MEKPAGSFDLRVERIHDYEFRVVFDKPTHPDLLLDEPPPLGGDRGPNPARLLAAAVGSCLAASLTFCLNRAKLPVQSVLSEVHTELVRNERRRLRIGRIRVRVRPRMTSSPANNAADQRAKCLEAFEDFCVVTESVRAGIPIEVSVDPELEASA